MKAITKQSNRKAAFTIVELLTVMSIIVILIGLLVPSLNKVRRYAYSVRQKAQFHSIEVAMDLFYIEYEGYPNSDAEDEDGKDYCGAMKLCEAMMGQDLLGFHPDSRFASDCEDSSGNSLYAEIPTGFTPSVDNLKNRKGPYLQLDNANAYWLKDLYGTGETGPFEENRFVLCDVYTNVKNLGATGKSKIGMPILYYRANTSGIQHDPNDVPTTPDDPDQIYDYFDNDELVKLGMPWNDPALKHTIESGNNPKKFYEMTKNDKIAIQAGRPYKSESYILLSAGFDGEYGTGDDIFNFEQ